MKNQYKLVAVDLDGTLLRSDGSLSTQSEAALRHLRRLSIPVVVCTGRGPRDLRPVLAAIEDSDYRVLCNGALIHSQNDRIIHAFEQADVFELVEFLEIHRCDAVVQDAEGSRYARPFRQPNDALHLVEPVLQARVRRIEDFRAPFPQPVVRVSAWTSRDRAESLSAAFAERYAGRFNSYLFDYSFWVFEVVPDRATKAKALDWIAERIGVSSDQVVAFGDGMNDLEMLHWAGLGVAMANGDPLVVSSADRVAPANDEDGVAQLIFELFPSVQSDAAAL